MKLIVAIINNDDSASVLSELTHKGYGVTKLATSGGFLKAGNSTLLIGTEDEKGRELEQAAHKLLQNTPVNYVGFVEARDVPLGAVDVLVTDGFTGNVILKLIEEIQQK